MNHTLVALVQDHPGVLTRVVSLFRRRGFNIESLAVGHSETAGISRITLVVESDDVEQVVKHLYRLIEVLKVTDVTGEAALQRELALVKVHASRASRAEVFALAKVFGATVAHVGAKSVVVEMNGVPTQVDDLLEVLRPFGVKELSRTGRIVMVPDGRQADLGERPGQFRRRVLSGRDDDAKDSERPTPAPMDAE